MRSKLLLNETHRYNIQEGTNHQIMITCTIGSQVCHQCEHETLPSQRRQEGTTISLIGLGDG